MPPFRSMRPSLGMEYDPSLHEPGTIIQAPKCHPLDVGSDTSSRLAGVWTTKPSTPWDDFITAIPEGYSLPTPTLCSGSRSDVLRAYSLI